MAFGFWFWFIAAIILFLIGWFSYYLSHWPAGFCEQCRSMDTEKRRLCPKCGWDTHTTLRMGPG